jgi:hypothetical protein
LEIKTPTKEERLAYHMRGIKMTLLPAILGAAAGLLSSPYVLSASYASFSLLIVAIAIYLQKLILPKLGIDSKAFGFKDWFYLTFMTFAFWFITWTIILTDLQGKMPMFGPLF